MSESESVCLYSELEPYSGSISNNLSDLPRLIRDLKLACLFYDRVIVHRGNILEHRLTLPAFKALKPFVEKGLLWTSTDESAYSPQGYIRQKLEKFFDKSPKKRKAMMADIEGRWAQITPSEWPIRRPACKQAAWVLERVNGYLSKKLKDKKFSLAHPVLHLVERMQANNNDFDRNQTLAKVGTLRGQLHLADLSEMATFIQGEFLRAGAKFNEAVIYPGKSAQCLTNPHFDSLPFDHLTLQKIKKCTKSVKFNLDKLIALPVSVLLELIPLEEWSKIRKVLSKNSNEFVEFQEEMCSIFESHKSFPSKLDTLLKASSHWNIDETSVSKPIIIPELWALAGQSLLGSASVVADDKVKEDSKSLSKTFILNLDNGVFYETKSPDLKVKLGEKQTHLLSILIMAGGSGLYAEHIKQLYIDLERITWKEPQWESQSSQTLHYRKNTQQNIDKLKFDTNEKIKLLGLKISVETSKGGWYLETEEVGTNLTLKLAGTTWEKFEKKSVKYAQLKLPPQLKLIWNEFQKNYPSPVSAEALAKTLGKDWDSRRIAKVISKLKKALANENWTIMRCGNGMYMMIPKSFLDDSTTT